MGDGGGAYAQDKNTSARLCTKNAGGGVLMREGDVFAGHYGNRLSAPGLYVANIAFTLLSPYCQLSTRSLLHFLILY